MKRLLPLILIVMLVLPLAAQDADLPEQITIQSPGLMPEGIAWDAENARFLVGSLSQGTVNAVADDGTLTAFSQDEALLSSVGIEVDAENGRLLVANSNSALFTGSVPEGPLALLGAYDLATGEQLFMADLTDLTGDAYGPTHFANDVAVDAEGNAYVTDSFAPVIYLVTPEGEASVFVEDERLSTQQFGLNGIVYHEDGYLLAAVTGAQALYRIPLDSPEDLSEVELDTPFGADGMALHPDGSLLAVASLSGDAGFSQAIVAVRSDDDWATATVEIVTETTGAATTLTVRDEAVYYINAYLSNPQQPAYEIVNADYTPES